MLQGVCMDTKHITALKKDTLYFLFPAGTTHFYVSTFSNQSSHRGCFETNRFKLVEDHPAAEKETTLLEEPGAQLSFDLG